MSSLISGKRKGDSMPISDKDYGLTVDGEVVARNDVRCVTTLAGKGGLVPDNVWKDYGLPKEFDGEPEVPETQVPEAKSVKGPPEDKAGLTIKKADKGDGAK
jgi:hypothetical protein